MNPSDRTALLATLPRDPESFIPALREADPKAYYADGFVAEMAAHGLPVIASTTEWALKYEGTNDFVVSVASKIKSGKPCTLRQARALLNHAIKDAPRTAGSIEPSSEDAITSIAIPAVKPHKCFVCDERFDTVREAANHRVRAHRGARSLEPTPTPSATAPKEEYRCRSCDHVAPSWEAMREHRKEHRKPLFDGVPQSGVDISSLPNGRYAVPNLDGDDYIFLLVKEVKEHTRSKKFRFGWKTYGEERVAGGTREVRQWSGDTKELVGEQRPGETYRGSHVREFGMILGDPIASTKLFGAIIGCCGRCGRTLTDPESRAMHIGPECIKHVNHKGDTDPEAHMTVKELEGRILAASTSTAHAIPKVEMVSEANPF